MLVDSWEYVSVWLAQCLVTVRTMLGNGWDNVGTWEPLAKRLVMAGCHQHRCMWATVKLGDTLACFMKPCMP